MRCERARMILLVGRAGPVEKSKANRHVEDCEGCRAYLASQESLDRVLRDSLSPTQVPPHLRERILSSIADLGERGKTARPFGFRSPFCLELRYAVGGALLSAALLTLVMVYKAESDRTSAWIDAFVSDYFEYLPKEHPQDLSTSVPEEIEKWFQGKVPFALRVPVLRNANLQGARLCVLKGEKSALLFYKITGVPVSLFVMDETTTPLGPATSISRTAQGTQIGSSKGLNLISWKNRGLVYTLVSSLDMDQMKNALSREVT